MATVSVICGSERIDVAILLLDYKTNGNIIPSCCRIPLAYE